MDKIIRRKVSILTCILTVGKKRVNKVLVSSQIPSFSIYLILEIRSAGRFI
jgi:hypothetical protein